MTAVQDANASFTTSQEEYLTTLIELEQGKEFHRQLEENLIF